MRDLMGGDNYYWEGTPLQPLYEMNAEHSDAVKRAGQKSGWLLKKVIAEDMRSFDTKEEDMIRKYLWVPGGSSALQAA